MTKYCLSRLKALGLDLSNAKLELDRNSGDFFSFLLFILLTIITYEEYCSNLCRKVTKNPLKLKKITLIVIQILVQTRSLFSGIEIITAQVIFYDLAQSLWHGNVSC